MQFLLDMALAGGFLFDLFPELEAHVLSHLDVWRSALRACCAARTQARDKQHQVSVAARAGRYPDGLALRGPVQASACLTNGQVFPPAEKILSGSTSFTLRVCMWL